MPDEDGRDASSATVLLVEDDEELRDIVADLLERGGYDVVPARNGKQALDYLTNARQMPALILLDLMMPIVNGWECLRVLKIDGRFASIPVVVTTANKGDRPPAVDAVLTKPFSVGDLLTTVLHFAGPSSRAQSAADPEDQADDMKESPQ